MIPAPVLHESIALTAAVDDLSANREGRLSEAQVAVLRRQERASVLVAITALLVASGFAGAALLLQPAGAVFFVLAAVAVIFTLGGGAAFWNYNVVRRDRELQMVERFEGTVEAAGTRWRLGDTVVRGEGVEAGKPYRVWFLRGSHRLLAAEPLRNRGAHGEVR